jgi:hypothetical protein
MEAQPIALALLFLPTLFLGIQLSTPLLDAGTIALILIGLHWWALLTRIIIRRSGDEHLIRPLQIQGLILACILTFGLLLLTGRTIVELIIPGALIIWAWRRGTIWTEKETHDEQLARTFKAGFIALIAVLLLSMLYYAQMSDNVVTAVPQNYTLAASAQALPLFFLSGLIALSFTRLEMIRKDRMRNTLGSSRLDPTSTWRLMLALTWIALVSVCVILETFSVAFLRALFIPVWNLILAILGTILYVIFAVLSLLFKPLVGTIPTPKYPRQPPPIAQQRPRHINNAAGISPVVEITVLLIIAIIVLLIVFLIVRAVLRYRQRKQDMEDTNEEEEREGLSMSAILKARREERQKRKQDMPAFALEPLDPSSARAYYRALLLTTFQHRSNLARQANETPLEYQRRLTSALNNATTQTGEETPPDPAIVAELTDAYVSERYGSKQLSRSQKGFLSQWVPNLLRHLTSGD